MTNGLYCLYNKLSLRYGDVVAYPSDGFASARVTDMAKRGAFVLNETELVKVGEIDIENGVVSALSAPVRVPLVDNLSADDLASPSAAAAASN